VQLSLRDHVQLTRSGEQTMVKDVAAAAAAAAAAQHTCDEVRDALQQQVRGRVP
jgi:hypothetical protein